MTSRSRLEGQAEALGDMQWADLFHEALAQADDLGKEDGVVGEVRAQVAEHAEGVLAQVLEGFGWPGSPAAPQGPQHAPLGPLGNAGPAGSRVVSVHFNQTLKNCKKKPRADQMTRGTLK